MSYKCLNCGEEKWGGYCPNPKCKMYVDLITQLDEISNKIASIGDIQAKQDKEDKLTEVQSEWELSEHMRKYWEE